MADHSPTGPVETGALMDYPEHERTYAGFLALAKYGALFCAALLIAMAFFFFATAGGVVNFISSVILMLLVIAVGAFLLR
ncbi:MAG: aa3-type cytochrome c oxidase subunit IV [Hyphomicrobiales bacterium]|nr:aa3-type cytochrome c oxidase subunit IV [Hyphomicrobiales bacterium]